jgi:hypothetical protein
MKNKKKPLIKSMTLIGKDTNEDFSGHLFEVITHKKRSLIGAVCSYDVYINGALETVYETFVTEDIGVLQIYITLQESYYIACRNHHTHQIIIFDEAFSADDRSKAKDKALSLMGE